MRRKMLIVIALITVMLFSCITPLIQVYAATDKVTMDFNTTLYKGLKEYFQEVGINAVYNDIEHSIKMEKTTLESITEISLKEKGIEDITGLDYFSNVSRLILSSNKLSEESNLGVLNNLSNLNYLDLSSNQIKDVSVLETLIERLLATDSNSVNLSSQIANMVIDVPINTEQENLTYEATLPQILNIAGIAKNGNIDNKGVLKAEWINEYNEISNVGIMAPFIINGSIPNPVSFENNTFEIQVGVETPEYVPFEGLVKLVISIKDKNLGGYNTNPSTKNILKDSIFTLYYVVHQDTMEGIIFKDENLYLAVKEQLTRSQRINKDLISYPYSLTEDGEIYYDVCNYTLNETTATLTIGEDTLYTIENFGTGNDIIYNAEGDRYYAEYEVIDVSVPDNNGVITTTRMIKVPHLNKDCRDLYVDAYDEPLALVITDLDLVNKITSLILNDQRIFDLSGLEKFVGLESNLNVSYNYIDTLEAIYGLQINKENTNKILQEVYTQKLQAMAASKTKVTAAYEKTISAVETIKEEIKAIEDNIAKRDAIEDTTSSEYQSIEKTIQASINKIYGNPEKDGDKGLIEEFDTALNDPQDGLNVNLSQVYDRLSNMYEVFNKEYKLTTLLIPELNYQTEIEYEDAKVKLETLEGAKALAKSQISRIETLEKANALTDLEKDLIVSAFGLMLSNEQEAPISYALNNLVKNYEETNARRTAWVVIVSKFEEINIYSAATNYCLIERMNNEVAVDQCFVKEYLVKQIKEYNYEGIDTSLLEAIYNKLDGESATGYNESLFSLFEEYLNSTRTLAKKATEPEQKEFDVCRGEYAKVTEISYVIRETSDNTITLPTAIVLSECIDYTYEENEPYFYNQLMALANKFTAINEVNRYVVLPALKRIDIRNNKIETLGETQVTMVGLDGVEQTTMETLASLKNLKEFYAGHNFVTGDITCVDWTQLNTLNKLDLSYNYISDILPLEVLTNLRYLDVSDNLLKGSFNLSLRKMTKLKDLILAGNRYEDISKILLDYEMLAQGNFTKYFAREDTLNLDLSRQKLEIIIEEPISYDGAATVMEIELPPIFAQLEHIDATRTAFGTTSTKGSIEATGGMVYVPISEIGDYEGKVKVIAENGYPEDVTTSIGINTECTIKYSVKEIRVDAVVINEDITKMEKGITQNFTATVEGMNVPDTTVTWSVEGANSEATSIDENGVLTVAADEIATQITVIATSNYDETKEDSKIIELFNKTVNEVVINEDNAIVEKGKTATFTAEVIGENLEDTDKTVTWEVTGHQNESTSIDENGILTVAVDETADNVTVIAKSNYDNTKIATTTVTLFVKTVASVTVSENTTSKPGTTVAFTAEVIGENLEDVDKGVTWNVYGNTTPYTMINATTGELTISENETADTLIVVATSKFDESKIGTAEVKLIIVKNVIVESEGNQLFNGDSMTFTANVEGSNLTDAEKEVTWEVIGANDTKTVISDEGILTIGADETAKKVVVKATSVINSQISATKEIEITIPIPKLGYNLDENDENIIVGISPSTVASNFKSKLVTDNKYTVVVKRNGEEISNTEKVATGDMAVIYFGDTVVEVYEIVVKGDVNGDGLANALDSSLIKAHRARLTTLTGVFYKAANIDNDKDITVKDVRLLLYHRARIDGYIL